MFPSYITFQPIYERMSSQIPSANKIRMHLSQRHWICLNRNVEWFCCGHDSWISVEMFIYVREALKAWCRCAHAAGRLRRCGFLFHSGQLPHKTAWTVRDTEMNLKLFFLSVSGYAQFQQREDQSLQTFRKGTEIKWEDAASLFLWSVSTHAQKSLFDFSCAYKREKDSIW